jgi:His-Xaa-Ser system protein HxsD
MTEHRLSFDNAGHSIDAVQRAAYRLSDRLSCEVSEGDGVIDVVLHIADNEDNPDGILADFRNEVLDQVLRERIRDETAEVRNLVLAAAFSKTGLADADV